MRLFTNSQSASGSHAASPQCEKHEESAEDSRHWLLRPGMWSLAIIASVFVLLAILSWRKMNDVLVDFGRELYVPWQLSEGATLYADIAYFNGPFSPYFNAALFHVFGVSYTTLMWANLAMTVVITGLIYHLFRVHTNRSAATFAAIVFLVTFAFRHHLTLGIFNYIAPYSHEMTHGILFCLLMFVCLGRIGEPISLWRHALAGFSCGIVFLGKAEIFVAALAAAVCYYVLIHIFGTARKQSLAGLAMFVFAAASPFITAACLLSAKMPFEQAVLHCAGSWRWLLTSDISDQVFYRKIQGTDQPFANMARMISATASVLAMVAALLAVDRWFAGGRSERKWLLVAAGGILVSIGLTCAFKPFLFHDRAITPIAALIWLGSVSALIFCRHNRPLFARALALLPWATFCLCLLLKMLLASRTIHYGFVLAMPATLSAVAAAIYFLPLLAKRYWRGGTVVAVGLVLMILLDVLGQFGGSLAHWKQKTTLLGGGSSTGHDTMLVHDGDQFYTHRFNVDSRGRAVQAVLEFAAQNLDSGDELLVLPEGISINYLLRRKTPTRFVNFMPIELSMYGEPAILTELESHQPAYVVLTHKTMRGEYGKEFGDPGAGTEIAKWLDEHYSLAKVILHQPFTDDQFGIAIYRLRGATDHIASHQSSASHP